MKSNESIKGHSLTLSEDDPVMKTYNIYTTSSLNDYLYLFQYPIRPSIQPYTEESFSKPLELRIKPKSGLVEVDVPIYTQQYYNKERGIEFSKNLENDPTKNKSPILDFQTLNSKISPCRNYYMVGIIRGDELHLSPVNYTLQLRPSFKHLNSLSVKEVPVTGSLSNLKSTRAVQTSAKSPEYSQTLTLSTTHILRSIESEPWTKLTWIDSSSTMSKKIFEHLYSNDINVFIQKYDSKENYLKSISIAKSNHVENDTKRES
ncbi:DNA-directed RNA polymerase III subunit C37 [Pneumocystis jirovecii RU7]|uniref:Uncharacterized protein n=1 Tax=Pneumocystis jirovecii (strain RU7) TaxID=1408657 RepID=A0A0W4ZFF9_PNEJ7|nr:DNA-directed RNA polymerase III subunit C37 [Pneumocystis jirovecii RU7]KTW27117.1 hypothetical protein T551_03111 [Pneumocystis jirovecii RU7]